MSCLAVHALLPALDHHAAEYAPWHRHLVPGASSPDEQVRAVAAHRHRFAQPHDHGPHTGHLVHSHAGKADPSGLPAVVAIAGAPEGLVSSLITAADLPPASAHWAVIMPAGGLWQQLWPASLFVPGFDRPPPVPPPRSPAG